MLSVRDDFFYRSLVEHLSHVVIDIDPGNYSILYVNRFVPGLNAEDVLGKSVMVFVPDHHHELFKNAMHRCLKENKTIAFEIEGYSQHGIVWYRSHVSPVLHNNGSKSVVLISENIQAQKDAERASLIRERKLEAVINNTSDLIFSIDKNLQIMEFNFAISEAVKHIFGVEMHAGMDVLTIVLPKNKNHQLGIYKRVLNGERLADIEVYDFKGEPNFYETHYNPITDENNEVSGLVVYSRNIHSRIVKESQLSTALREKELLLSEIHHRLKNNLAIISSLLELQEQNMNNDESRRSLFESRQRIKSTALLHELLYENTSFERIDVRHYLQRLFDMISSSMGGRIKLELSGDSPVISSRDAVSFGLLFNELFTNSFKHAFSGTDDDGRISIFFKISEGKIHVDFEESKGRFPEHIQLNDPATTGLIIIRSFIDQLQGSIALSREPNTCFHIVLNAL